MKTPVATNHRICQVENASLQLRRIYRVMRETIRAMSGYIAQASRMQTKRLLAKHAWIDSTQADVIRQRVVELRYPRVDVDDGIPAPWLDLLSFLPRASNEAEFLKGIYRVVKPRIRKAIEEYLESTDEIDDAPSHLYLPRFLPELDQQIEEAEEEIARYSNEDETAENAWVAYLNNAFDALGGLALSSLENTPHELLQCPGITDRIPYRVPDIPRRDPSFENAVMQVAPRAPRNDVESRVWLAIDHANESWAGELPSSLIWEYPNISWELLRDSTRWAYDELRHAMMGERRLCS